MSDTTTLIATLETAPGIMTALIREGQDRWRPF